MIEEEKKIPITDGYRNKLFDCDGEFLALDESYMQVGDVKKSALLIKEILKMGFSHPVAVHLGFKVRSGEHLDITYLNCGAALVVAGKAKNIEEGMDIAYKEILSGRPLLKLYNLIKITNKKYYDRYIKKYIKR